MARVIVSAIRTMLELTALPLPIVQAIAVGTEFAKMDHSTVFARATLVSLGGTAVWEHAQESMVIAPAMDRACLRLLAMERATVIQDGLALIVALHHLVPAAALVTAHVMVDSANALMVSLEMTAAHHPKLRLQVQLQHLLPILQLSL